MAVYDGASVEIVSVVVDVRRRWVGHRRGRARGVEDLHWWCSASLLDIRSRNRNRWAKDGDDEPIAANGGMSGRWVVGRNSGMSGLVASPTGKQRRNNLEAYERGAFDEDDDDKENSNTGDGQRLLAIGFHVERQATKRVWSEACE